MHWSTAVPFGQFPGSAHTFLAGSDELKQHAAPFEHVVIPHAMNGPVIWPVAVEEATSDDDIVV